MKFIFLRYGVNVEGIGELRRRNGAETLQIEKPHIMRTMLEILRQNFRVSQFWVQKKLLYIDYIWGRLKKFLIIVESRHMDYGGIPLLGSLLIK